MGGMNKDLSSIPRRLLFLYFLFYHVCRHANPEFIDSNVCTSKLLDTIVGLLHFITLLIGLRTFSSRCAAGCEWNLHIMSHFGLALVEMICTSSYSSMITYKRQGSV